MRRLCPLLLAALCAAAPLRAQVEGIGYRLTPSVSYLDFAAGAALSDGLLVGGGLGLSFGEFVELGGAYQLGSFETDLAALVPAGDPLAAPLAALARRSVDVHRYGGALRLNLTRTALVPYLTAGTGIVRLDPDDIESTRSIYLLGGAGLQLTLADRYAVSLSAEDFVYRYNPGAALVAPADAAAAGLVAGDFDQRTVHNFGVRASASVYLGGRRPGALSDVDRELQRQFSGGLGGLSLVVEPFYGRVTFAEPFDLRDQTFVGAEAGVDFGPLVGLRGFYGRGTDELNPTETDPIQMVGGALRLRLSEGRGLVPYLTVGGGYLDVLDGYASEEDGETVGARAEDTPFASAGAGIGFLVSPRLRATVEARGLLMSTQNEQDLSTPDDVYLSTMLRGGVSFGIGGRSRRRAAREPEADAERRALEDERDALRAELAALERQRDAERQRARLAALDAQLDRARAEGDLLAVERLEAERVRLRAEGPAPSDGLRQPPGRDAPDAERLVTIPLPREGELYVRYGPPGDGIATGLGEASRSLAEADLRTAVRAALVEVLAADPATSTLTEADVAEIEQRVVDRMLLATADTASPTVVMTAEDLERLERRLEDRLLRALGEALRQRDADPSPQN